MLRKIIQKIFIKRIPVKEIAKEVGKTLEELVEKKDINFSLKFMKKLEQPKLQLHITRMTKQKHFYLDL